MAITKQQVVNAMESAMDKILLADEIVLGETIAKDAKAKIGGVDLPDNDEESAQAYADKLRELFCQSVIEGVDGKSKWRTSFLNAIADGIWLADTDLIIPDNVLLNDGTTPLIAGWDVGNQDVVNVAGLGVNGNVNAGSYSLGSHYSLIGYQDSLSLPADTNTWVKLAEVSNNINATFFFRNGAGNKEEVAEVHVFGTYHRDRTGIEVIRQTYNRVLEEIRITGSDGGPKTIYALMRGADGLTSDTTWSAQVQRGSINTIYNTLEDPAAGLSLLVPNTDNVTRQVVGNLDYTLRTENPSLTLDRSEIEASSSINFHQDGTLRARIKEEGNLVIETLVAGFKVLLGGGAGVNNLTLEGAAGAQLARFAGKVGVGVSGSIDASLHVNGDALISTNLSVAQAGTFNTDKGAHDFIVHGDTVDNVFRVDAFSNMIRAAGDIRIADADPRLVLTDTDGGDNMFFRVLLGQIRIGNESTGQDFLTILQGGDFGVRTSTPVTDFDVNGQGHFSGKVRIGTTDFSDPSLLHIKNDSTDGGILLENGHLVIKDGEGGTNTSLNDDGGNSYVNALGGKFGVRTASPLAVVDVAHTGSDNEPVRVGDPNTVSSTTGLYLRTTGDAKIGVGSGGTLHLGNLPGNDGHVAIKQASGRVGINTPSPSALFHIKNGDLMIENDAATGGTGVARILFSENAPTGHMRLEYDGDNLGADANRLSVISDKNDSEILSITYGEKVVFNGEDVTDSAFDVQMRGTGLFGLSTDTVTASSTDAQGEAPMTASINRITDVPDSSSAVTAPLAKFGSMFGVVNEGNFSVKMYPASSQEFREQDISVPTSKTIQVGQYFFYVCMEDGLWHEITGP